MSDRFAAASGRKVVSRKSAEGLGTVAHIVVDVKRRQVASLVVGKGRKALLVDWEHVSGFRAGRGHGRRRERPASAA